MNVMFDTNVLLDDTLNRAPNDKNAKEVLRFVTSGKMKGFITANSLTDIFYVMARACSDIGNVPKGAGFFRPARRRKEA